MTEFARTVNTFVIYILCFILTGAFFYEYGYSEPPCPLCFLQRLMMIGVGMGFMLNIYHGIRVSHYDVSYFSAIIGAATSMRQILLHICPNQKAFGLPVFGLSLYSWAFLVFVCTIIGISVLLMFYRHQEDLETNPKLNAFHKIAIGYQVCGLGACAG